MHDPDPRKPVRRTADVIYSVRAKSDGEVLAHCITRAAFLRLVVGDARTRDLFARWRHESKLDLVVAEWSAQLDAAASRLGLPHRAILHHDAAVYDRIPGVVRAFFAECEQLRQLRRARTLDARAADVDAFVCSVLYREPPPFRASLAADLVEYFDADIIREVWGEDAAQLSVSAGPLDTVAKGQRPKREGEHLEQYALWYYRAEIAIPSVTHAALARERYTTLQAAGTFLGPKDRKDITERADTKVIRDGIAEAKRLLALVVPPEQWEQYFKIQA